MKATQTISKTEQALYWASIISVLLCWSPSNVLGYLSPFIFTSIVILFGEQLAMIQRILFFGLIFILQTFFYLIVNDDFQVFNSAISLFTWAGILVVVLYPYDSRIKYDRLQRRLYDFLWIVLLLESTLGIIQGLYGFSINRTFDEATGDFVEGTLHPSLEPEQSFSNPMFSTNMAILLILLIFDLKNNITKKKVIIYLLGVISLIMASTGHVIVAFAVSLVISLTIVTVFAIYKTEAKDAKILLKSTILVLIIATSALTFLYVTQRGNFTSIAGWLTKRDTPRILLIRALTERIPQTNWLAPIVGFGPGQFASRAGLISTGLYFGSNWHKTPSDTATKAQRHWLIPLKRVQIYNPTFGRSSNAAPHSSWLALYSELGLLGVGLLLYYLSVIIRSLLKLVKISHLAVSLILSSIMLLLLIGWQETYWEIPQAWFSGIIIVKILYFKLKQYDLQQ